MLIAFCIISCFFATSTLSEKVKEKQEIVFCEEEDSDALVLEEGDLLFFEEENEQTEEVSFEEE